MEALYYLDDTGRLTLAIIPRNRIKMAARELRRLTGLGYEEIAKRTHASKSQWHNYENPDAPDLIPPIVFLPLELELGQAPVSKAYAALNGLCTNGQPQERQRQFTELMAEVARESGEALSALIESVKDGKMSPNEARRVAREFDDVAGVVERVKNVTAQFMTGRGGDE